MTVNGFKVAVQEAYQFPTFFLLSGICEIFPLINWKELKIAVSLIL